MLEGEKIKLNKEDKFNFTFGYTGTPLELHVRSFYSETFKIKGLFSTSTLGQLA